MKDKIAHCEFEPYMVPYLEKQVAFYKVKDKEELRQIIRSYIEIAGNECSLNWLDTSGLESMSNAFSYCYFNGKIDKWDTSKVENMCYMFDENPKFNQDISMWDVSNVAYFNGMFRSAESFNQPLNDWNVSSARMFNLMFCEAKKFNQPLDKWSYKLDNVITTARMFEGATSFNQDISEWQFDRLVPQNCMKMFYKCRIQSKFKPKLHKSE